MNFARILSLFGFAALANTAIQKGGEQNFQKPGKAKGRSGPKLKDCQCKGLVAKKKRRSKMQKSSRRINRKKRAA